MPLTIVFDHRPEALARALVDRLAWPHPDPLAVFPVIAPSVGVGRWLQHCLAREQGICAGVSIDLPGSYLWKLLGRVFDDVPETSPFDPDRLRWSLLRLFSELAPPDGSDGSVDLSEAERADLQPLVARLTLSGDVERLVLASTVARQFDRYGSWRRDWLARWEQGAWAERTEPLSAHEPWQRWLWNALRREGPAAAVGGDHPYDRLRGEIEHRPERLRTLLANDRITLFGAVSMSLEQYDLYGLLGRVADVAILSHNPCREYWEDLSDSRTLARIRAQSPDEAWLFEGEPSILGDWGRAQRDQIALISALQEQAGVQAIHESPGFEQPWRPDEPLPARLTVLQALQASVFLRSNDPWLRVARPVEGTGLAGLADSSIELHATHGLMREAEVLHERLLTAFDQLADLKPQEVLVLCTNLDAAAEAIDAVFGRAVPEQRIPISVSGRTPRRDPAVAAVLDWLMLTQSGLQIRTLADWLAQPLVMDALDLDSDTLTSLMALLGAAGASSGLDAEQGPASHNWQIAIDRLLLGAAMGAGAPQLDSIGTVAGFRSSQHDEACGRLFGLMDFARRFSQAPVRRSLSDWSALLQQWLLELLSRPGRQPEGVRKVREALGALQESASAEAAMAFDLGAFSRLLADELESRASAGLPGSAVSVCPMGSLRAVPYRVICLFGFDEHAFPRPTSRIEYDLIAQRPRFGDRVTRFDERAAFLDALLAAGERVIILYRGRDLRDDAALNPSQLVLELQRYVRHAGAASGVNLAVTQHPLHGFAARNFDARLDSGRARHWYPTACALAQPLAVRAQARLAPLEAPGAPGAPPVPSATLAPAGRLAPRLSELLTSFNQPARRFLEASLGLRLPRESEVLAEREPLDAKEGDARRLLDETLRALLRGESDARARRALEVNPHMPTGAAGRRRVALALDEAWSLVNAAWERESDCREALAAPVFEDEQLIEIPGPADPGQILGAISVSLPALARDEPLRIVGGFPASLYLLADAWLQHCARGAVVYARAIASGEAPEAARRAAAAIPATRVLVPDSQLQVSSQDPLKDLAHALSWHERIQREPLSLFPKTIFSAWAAKLDLSGGIEPALNSTKIEDIFVGADGGSGEYAKPLMRALYRDCPPRFEDVLLQGAEVYGPILAACRRAGQRAESES